MIKRIVSLSTLVVFLLAPMSVITKAAGPTELSFWTFVDAHGKYWSTEADLWNKANPDRQIKLTPTILPWDDMHNKLLLALNSGTGAPDLVDIEISRFSAFIKGDIHLQDITDLVDSAKDNLVATRLIYQWQGKQYGIDYHVGTFLMFYNKTIMDKAGVDVDKIKTWDDYIAAGKKVTTDKVQMTSVELTGCFQVRGLMLMNGGGTYDKDGNLIIDSPKNAEALQFVSDLVNVSKIAVTAPGGNDQSPEFYKAMNAGQFASIFMPEWYLERFTDLLPDLKGQIVVRPMPVFKDKPGTFASAMGGGTGTSITDQIDPGKLQLAKDFLKFSKLTHDAGVNIWTNLGFDPIVKDAYADPALTKPLPYFNNEDVMSTIKGMQGNLAAEYLGPQYADVMNIFGSKTCYDVIQKGVKPDAALADLKKQVLAAQ